MKSAKVRFKKLNNSAVSPVIATILMVAITVVLATILYVIISGLITTPKDVQRSTAQIGMVGDEYYRVSGFTLTKQYPLDLYLTYSLRNEDGASLLQGVDESTSVEVRDVYNANLGFFEDIPGYDVTFVDANDNQVLDSDDSFLISASSVGPGYSFRVSYRNEIIIEETIS